jgi:hypothetical protein
MDNDYMVLEWTSLLGPDDDPTWFDWQKLWEVEANKTAHRMKLCQRRAAFCAQMSQKADEYDEHV